MRPLDHDLPDHMCGCACYNDAFTVVADGTETLLRVVREELRRGAFHIKIMLSGSVVSPHTSVNHSEYSDAEISTIVEVARRAGKYVTAHCHTAEAIRRGVSLLCFRVIRGFRGHFSVLKSWRRNSDPVRDGR